MTETFRRIGLSASFNRDAFEPVGLGWVCENHPDKAYTELEGGCQCGAGMICERNRANGEDAPDVKGIIEEVAGEPRKTRH